MFGLFLLFSFVDRCALLSVVVPTAPVAVAPGDMALLPATLVLPAPPPPFFQVRWRFLPTGRLVLLLAAHGCGGAAPWRESCHLGLEQGWGYESRAELGPHDASLRLWDARAEDAGTYRVSLLGLDIRASAELNLTLIPSPTADLTSLPPPTLAPPLSSSALKSWVWGLRAGRLGVSQSTPEPPHGTVNLACPQLAHSTLLTAVSQTSSLGSLNSSTTRHQRPQTSEVLSEGTEPPLSPVRAAEAGRGAEISNMVRLGLAGLVLCILALIVSEHVLSARNKDVPQTDSSPDPTATKAALCTIYVLQEMPVSDGSEELYLAQVTDPTL